MMALIIPSSKSRAVEHGVFLTDDGGLVVGDKPRGACAEFADVETACDEVPTVKAAATRRAARDAYMDQFKQHDREAAYELKVQDAEQIIQAQADGVDPATLDLVILDQEAIIRNTDLGTLAQQVLAHYPAKVQKQAVILKELERVQWKQNQA